jgi:hypothetical protein
MGEGMTRTILASVVALTCAGVLPGCFLIKPEYAFIEGDDVTMDPVRGAEFRAADGATEYGDIYAISMQSAHEVGGWISVVIETTRRTIDLLDRFPSDVDDAGYKVYGPYQPGDSEVSWLFRLDGDERSTRFEVYVGRAGAEGAGDMDVLLRGEVELGEARRRGSFDLDFDVLESYGEALKLGPDRDRRYTGAVSLVFDRDLESDYKHIDIDYDGFTVTQEVPIRDYFAASGYNFHREADGSGDFHVEIASTFQAMLWSGPEVESMVIDMAWDRTGAGAAHGEMREGEAGDLLLGDLVLDECFDEQGALVWREIGAAYAEALPGYNRGDSRDCAR